MAGFLHGIGAWVGLRWGHAAALEDDLSKFASNARIVHRRRYQACRYISYAASMPTVLTCSLPCTKLIAAPVRPPMPEIALLAELAALFA